MAKLTTKEKNIVEMYVRYFGKTPSVDEISKYSEFKTKSAITKEIRLDSDVENNSLTNLEYVENAIQNLFGRPATTNEKKYAVKKDNNPNYVLPIATILKKGSSVDKAVYNTKKLVAQMFAEEKSTVAYNLDNITRENYSSIYNTKTKKLVITTSTELETKLVEVPDNITGKTFNLTTSVNQGAEFTGTEKSDVFYANYDINATLHTLGALDELDGGAGKDTLKITNDDGTNAYEMASATIKNIETITIKGTGNVTADVSGSNITGLETISVLKSAAATVTAATTTDVNVSGATGDITVKGGNDITITDNAAGSSIKVQDTNGNYATGKITITDTNFGAGKKIDVDGGTDVTITATADKVDAGAITVGASKTATGDVKIVSNTTSDGTAVQAGSVTVTGGKTVEITANMTNTATTGKGSDISAGTYTVTAGDTTSSVTITQNSTATDLDAVTTGNVTETASVKFGALKSGDKITISVNDATADPSELTFTASKDLTAAEVAAAFASLTNLDTQTSTGPISNGIFSGALSLWTSGAANGDTVVFTSTTKDTPVTNLQTVLTNTSGNSTAAVVTTTDGNAGTKVPAQDVTAKYGAVVIDDNATASITTITLDGFAGATLGAGGSGSLDKLATLNLTNGTGATALTSTVATLTVNVDDMAGTVDLSTAAANLKTLTLNANGEDSKFALTAAAVETLTIAAAADLDISGSTLTKLATATITGAGDVKLGNLSTLANFATLNASAAKGAISATVAGTATVTTGLGDDKITVNTATGTTVTKAISLGDGKDRLDLSTLDAVGATTAAISGGADSDTVVLGTTNALVGALSSVPNSDIIKSKITGFEKLELKGAIGSDGTVNVGNLGYNYVITSALAANYDLTLADMANNGTVELNSIATTTASTTDGVIVNLKDATGKADVLNVVLNAENDDDEAGILTVANVETIHISTVDLDTKDKIDAATQLKLVADSAKTVTVDGDADLTLDMAGNTAVTLIDGSKMTGNLTVTALNSGMTVKGGEGDDTLSVVGAKSGVVLTGGKGTDTFDVSQFDSSGNAGSAVTITDLTAGETIKFAATDKFVSSKVTLIGEASFESYVAEASKVASDAGAKSIAWFQYNNNTFVVQDIDGTSGLGVNDIIVKINGVKDLSTASFNGTDGTLEIA